MNALHLRRPTQCPKPRFARSKSFPISATISCNGLPPAPRKSLSPGDVFIREGDPADALFVLLEGEIRGRRENGGADSPALWAAPAR